MDMNQSGMPMSGDKKICNCSHHKVIPWSIILIGVVLILNAIPGVLTPMWTGILVGVLLVIIGGTKLGSRKCKCC